MKALKLVLLFIIVTIVMAVSWAIGSLLGNVITSSTPPPLTNGADAGLAFLMVCAFNAGLVIALVGMTQSFTGARRRLMLILYVFVIQSLLPQMETYFFASEIGIGYDQTTAILIAGAITSVVTMMTTILLYNKLIGAATVSNALQISFSSNKKISLYIVFLVLVVYPFLYLAFGYYIAWQNEALRIYYTSSAFMASFGHQLLESFSTGIYFFQILRGLIWIAVTIPVVLMLKQSPLLQFIVVGIYSALLPTSLLFIPNPYMPEAIAMTHFVETSTSNFIWGLLMVGVIRMGVDSE